MLAAKVSFQDSRMGAMYRLKWQRTLLRLVVGAYDPLCPSSGARPDEFHATGYAIAPWLCGSSTLGGPQLQDLATSSANH
jgi:hypothetical protein